MVRLFSVDNLCNRRRLWAKEDSNPVMKLGGSGVQPVGSLCIKWMFIHRRIYARFYTEVMDLAYGWLSTVFRQGVSEKYIDERTLAGTDHHTVFTWNRRMNRNSAEKGVTCRCRSWKRSAPAGHLN